MIASSRRSYLEESPESQLGAGGSRKTPFIYISEDGCSDVENFTEGIRETRKRCVEIWAWCPSNTSVLELVSVELRWSEFRARGARRKI